MSRYEDRRNARRRESRGGSERPKAPPQPRPGPSVYERLRVDRRPEPVTVAEANPFIGDLEWVPGWHRRAAGWQPFGEFVRDFERRAAT